MTGKAVAQLPRHFSLDRRGWNTPEQGKHCQDARG
jgi:hypothetical protein